MPVVYRSLYDQCPRAMPTTSHTRKIASTGSSDSSSRRGLR